MEITLVRCTSGRGEIAKIGLVRQPLYNGIKGSERQLRAVKTGKSIPFNCPKLSKLLKFFNSL